MTDINCGRQPQNHRKPPQTGPQIVELPLKQVELLDEVIELEAEEVPETGQNVRPIIQIRTDRTAGQFLKQIRTALGTKYRAFVLSLPDFFRRSGRLAGQVGKLVWAIVRFVLSVAWMGVIFVHRILKVIVPVVLPWLAGFTVLLTIAYGIVLIGEWLIAQKAFWSGLAIVSGAAYLVWMAAMFLSVRRRRPRMPRANDSGPVTRYDPGDAGPVSRSDRTVINILNHVSVSRSGKTVINIFNQIIKND